MPPLTFAMRWRLIWLPGVVLGLMCSLAQAATLHLVLVPDTRDQVIGKDMDVNANRVEFAFRGNVPNDQLNVVRVAPNPGDRLDRDAVLRAIFALPVRPDDSVVYFYTGHGAFNSNRDLYGQPFGTYVTFTGNDSVLYQSEVRDAIARHRPKLSAVIIDCCNPLRPINIGPRPAMAFPTPVMEDLVSLSPLFAALFFDRTGTIVLESSAPGQYAFVKPVAVFDDGARENKGSLFTGSFVDVLDSRSQQQLDWTQLQTLTQNGVTAGFRTLDHARHLILQGSSGRVDQADQTVTLVFSDLR